jgi:hypothetical protein
MFLTFPHTHYILRPYKPFILIIKKYLGKERKLYKVFVKKLEGKRPLGRPRSRYEHGINGSSGDWLRGVEWIHLAQVMGWWRAVVNTVLDLRVLAPRS